MNKSLSIFALLVAPLFASAQSSPELPDTIKVINSPDRITISRNGDTTLIEVESPTDFGRDLFSYKVKVEEQTEDTEPVIDLEIPLGIGKKNTPQKKKLQTSVFFMGNGYIGQRFNYSDKGNVKNSYEVGFRNVVGLRWSHGPYTPSFSIGLGCGVANYAAQRGYMYAKEGSNLILTPVKEGSKTKLNQFGVFSFQVPLLFTIPIGREVEFVAGAVGCFNTYAKARTELDFGNYKTTTIYKGLQQRLFTTELTASIGISDLIGVYASWSPMTIFKAPYGPQLKSWSLGATINF